MSSVSASALARRIADLERRLRSVERAPQLPHSAVASADGTASVNVPRALLAGSDGPKLLADAVQTVATAAATADGLLTVWYTQDPPDTPGEGDVWVQPPDSVLARLVGGVWVVMEDQTPAVAIVAANDMISTADGRIDTYWQDIAPVEGGIGDLWFKTDNASAPHRWDGDAWVPIITQVAQSTDYQPGEAGWAVKPDGDAQFNDLQALGQLGATVISADSITLAGADLGETLSPLPLGIIREVYRGGVPAGKNAGDTNGTTELRVFTIAGGDLRAGRLYRVQMHGHLQATVAAGATDAYDMRLRYTTDGSLPSVASPVFPGGTKRINLPASGSTLVSDDFALGVEFSPASDAPYNFAVTLRRALGAGAGRVVLELDDRRFEWTLEDCGLAAAAQAPDALQQTAYSDGSGSDNPPVTTRTKTWYATRTDHYMSLGIPEAPTDTNNNRAMIGWDPYMGPPSAYGGADPDYSVMLFDSGNIMTTLATATEVVSFRVTFRGLTREAAAGLDLAVFTHTYTGAPGSIEWTTEVAAGRIVPGAGSRNDVAPGVTYSVELGPTIGAQFRTGTRRGLGFYAATFGSNGRGELYGYPHGSRPSITAVYKSP